MNECAHTSHGCAQRLVSQIILDLLGFVIGANHSTHPYIFLPVYFTIYLLFAPVYPAPPNPLFCWICIFRGSSNAVKQKQKPLV